MQSVILAAGRGIRLKPITDEIPKCMVGIKGVPLLEILMQKLANSGIGDFNLVVGYKKEIIEEHFGNEFEGIKIKYFVQSEPKGTAHALSLVEKHINEKFLLTNSDVIVPENNYKKMLETDEFEKLDALALSRKVNDPWRYGVLKTEQKKIIDIIEKPSPGNEPSNLVSTGIYRFKKDIFESIKEIKLSQRGEYELVDAVKNYITKGKIVESLLCEGECLDIGTIEDLEKANEIESEFPE